MRRLDKAARAGNGNAADLLRRVIDPNDAMTVNGACVAMGWRKPTVTVIDTPDGMADAVRRIGLALVNPILQIRSKRIK